MRKPSLGSNARLLAKGREVGGRFQSESTRFQARGLEPTNNVPTKEVAPTANMHGTRGTSVSSRHLCVMTMCETRHEKA